MNRIRKVNNTFQVLASPYLRLSPDVPLFIGNLDDPNMVHYYILEFNTMSDALAEAYTYPDINWVKIIDNQTHIFIRLRTTIQSIIDKHHFNVEFKPVLLDGNTLKNNVFDRISRGGDIGEFRFENRDVIEFNIINPWTSNLKYMADILVNYREHLFRDDLRLKTKKVISGKIIYIYGYTELGTMYKIKLMPTLLYQWIEWYNAEGYRNKPRAEQLYNKILHEQDELDKGYVIR